MPMIGPRSAKCCERAAVFLFVDEASMEDGLQNWLLDEFSDDEALILLEIGLPDDFPLIPSREMPDVEVLSVLPIPERYIRRTKRVA